MFFIRPKPCSKRVNPIRFAQGFPSLRSVTSFAPQGRMNPTSPQSSTSRRHLAPTPLGYEDDVFSQSELNEIRTSFHHWGWEATTNVVAGAGAISNYEEAI